MGVGWGGGVGEAESVGRGGGLGKVGWGRGV